MMLSVIVYLIYTKRYEFTNLIKRILKITLTLLITIFLISIFVFPVYEIPSPTGDYLIGTTSYMIEDDIRDELYTKDLSDHRKINIQMWYPALK